MSIKNIFDVLIITVLVGLIGCVIYVYVYATLFMPKEYDFPKDDIKMTCEGKLVDDRLKTHNVQSYNTYGVNDVYLNGVQIKNVLVDTGSSFSFVCNERDFVKFKDKCNITDADFIKDAYAVTMNKNITTGKMYNLKTLTIGKNTFKDVRLVVFEGCGSSMVIGMEIFMKFKCIALDFETKELILTAPK